MVKRSNGVISFLKIARVLVPMYLYATENEFIHVCYSSYGELLNC